MAPNVLTNYITPLLAQGLQTFRSRSILPLIANRGYEPTPGAKGTTVNINVPGAMSVLDVVPGHVAPDTPAATSTVRSIVVDQWKEAPFTMTDSDLMKVTMGIIPQTAEQAIIALVKAVETHLWSKFVLKVPYMNGTPGTTPFAVNATTGLNDMSVFINARKALNLRDVPDDARWAVIDPDAAGNLFNGRQFVDAAFRGDQGGIVAGVLGTKWGVNWVESNKVPTNVATPLTAGAATVNGVNAAGATSVSIAKATNASPLIAGNTITIGSGPAAGLYRVTADTTLIVGNTTVPIFPPLRGATAGGETVTLTATAVQNVLFDRNALGFVSRPLAESNPPGLDKLALMDYIVDPITGLAMRLEVTREHKQWRWSYDMLWGADIVREDWAQVILG